MEEFMTLQQIDLAAETLRVRIKEIPRIGMILGSGLGGLADLAESPINVPVSEIPYWPAPTVLGHKGKLVIGRLEEKPIMILQGRAHYYEGHSMAQVTFPVRVMQRLGVEILIVTNAAGAINPDYKPGDLMLISDHISLVAMNGLNPLRGPNIDEIGVRFPDMSKVYDRDLMELSRQSARDQHITLNEGVYICLAGPSFETPADLRFLRGIGADAVGMSTVPEVIVARHGNMRVLGISGISNKANLDGSTVTTHEEVLQAGKLIVPKLQAILFGILERI
jgi:purine-nucleoside phosphorylase